MAMFEPGDKVRTNKEYFVRTGRKVEGTVIRLYCDVPDNYVGVIWEKQEGNIDVCMQGLKVLMNGKELELAD